MADKTITELGNQTSADLQDKLVIVDMTHFNTNNIEVGDFASSIFNANLPITSSGILVNGDLNVANSGEFYLGGNKLFNYGDFYDTTIQSGSANTAYPMKLNSTNISHNVNIVSGSRITPSNTGVYNLQFSAQLSNTANTNMHFDIWLAYTGSNVPYTNTQVDVNKVSGNLSRVVASWNFLKEIRANDYVEIMWSCNDSTGQIYATGSNTIHPELPSVIATITQIS